MDDRQVDVLIVGGGTVGLFSALFLSRLGVSTLTVDRHPAPLVHPRAMGIGPRTVELLREAGIADAVDAVCMDMSGSDLQMFSTPTLAEADLPALAAKALPRLGDFDHVTPQTLRGTCPQSELDKVVLDAARTQGADVRFGTELRAFTQDESGVTAELDGPHGRTGVRARYMVAADGARSGVRAALGIGTSGPGTLGLPLISMLFRSDLSGLTQGQTFTMCEITTPAAPGGLLPVDGKREWIYHTRYDPATGRSPADFTPELCLGLIRAAVGVPALDAEVVSVLPWQVRGAVADHFHTARVLLTGDAAHVVPPVGAFGMNTGVADAHNLAWKLAYVLSGAAGPGLLETYEAERRPVALTTLEQALNRLGDPSLHWGRGPEAAARRAAAGTLNAPVLHLGYRYDSAAVIDARPALPSAEDVEADLDGAPGSRLPHVWLSRSGTRVSTLDLVRSRFTLLTGPGGAAWLDAARDVSAELDVEVDGHRIGRRPGPDGELGDPEARWPDVAGIGETGTVLVRPDGFVGWRATSLPAFPGAVLYEVLAKLLCSPSAEEKPMDLRVR
ncbi:FAD-dependent monooxygenase [Sphaerisporangium sp. NPDC088356]|uniref:FAD-dependent monooxygenase n=1 Tax=Sphaerisporangium sp. NPDC088356 TaxID=3154871 RepID=UPI00342AB3B4